MSWVGPIRQVVTSANLGVYEGVSVTAELGQQDCVGAAVTCQSAFCILSGDAGHLHHCGCDAEGAVPTALRTGVGDSLRGAFFRGVGHAARQVACCHYFFEVESERDAHFDSHTDGVTRLLGQLALYVGKNSQF